MRMWRQKLHEGRWSGIFLALLAFCLSLQLLSAGLMRAEQAFATANAQVLCLSPASDEQAPASSAPHVCDVCILCKTLHTTDVAAQAQPIFTAPPPRPAAPLAHWQNYRPKPHHLALIEYQRGPPVSILSA